MTNTIELPQKVIDGIFDTDRIPAGSYFVKIKKMITQMNRLTAVCVIQDEGEYKDRVIFDSFNLEYEVGQKLFREFLDAVGVSPHSGLFDLDAIVGKTLSVTVKHKEDNGKVFVNVTDHMPF